MDCSSSYSSSSTSSCSSSSSSPSPSNRLFNRQRSVHEILGGGLIADVMLWRKKNVTIGILMITLAAWVVFEKSGYTLLSLVANVFLLLLVILFVWAKSAALLNRPPPPIPNLHLSEEVMNEAGAFVRTHVNALLSVSRDISLGKDSKLFCKVAAVMWFVSVIGGWTDFPTLGYTSLVIILTIPVLYEKYEDHIDGLGIKSYKESQQLYMRLDAECFSKIRRWILEKKKLS